METATKAVVRILFIGGDLIIKWKKGKVVSVKFFMVRFKIPLDHLSEIALPHGPVLIFFNLFMGSRFLEDG